MNDASPFLARRRRIVHISGFEPVAPEMLARRLTSGLGRFAPLWGAKASRSAPDLAPDSRTATFDVDASGPNWSTSTRYTILRWDDLMAPYVDQPWLGRVLSGYRALIEFARTGTIRRYFKAHVRYGLFVIYPFLVMGLFAVGAILLAVVAALVGVPHAGISAPLIAVVAFVLMMRLLSGAFYLDFALADWAFAADLARGDVKGFDAVVDRFADEVRTGIADSEADEVLLSSISLGCVMLVEALARALDEDPNLLRGKSRVTMVSVGSSILKIGLHPAAERLRRVVGRVGGEKSLFWVEYQAKVDFINFHKTDPVADLGNPPTGSPIVRGVRMRDMMSSDDYKRAQRNLLLMHRQFVMPNGRRYFYDFYQICFGPMLMRERIALGEAAAQAFAEDGSFRRPVGVEPELAVAAARQ